MPVRVAVSEGATLSRHQPGSGFGAICVITNRWFPGLLSNVEHAKEVQVGLVVS